MAFSPVPRYPSGRKLHPEQRKISFPNDDSSIIEQLNSSISSSLGSSSVSTMSMLNDNSSTTSSIATPTSNGTRRKVRFSSTVRAKKAKIKYYTPRELGMCFYTDEELEDINDDIYHVVVLHTSAPEKLHPTNETTRGLEDQIKIHQGCIQYSSEAIQLKSKNVVLTVQQYHQQYHQQQHHQQKTQQNISQVDVDAIIAKAYRKVTKNSMEEARQRGIVDEHTARMCWLEQQSPSSSSKYSYTICSSSNQQHSYTVVPKPEDEVDEDDKDKEESTIEKSSSSNDTTTTTTTTTIDHVDCVARATLLRQKRRERIRQTVASMAA